MSLKYGKTEIRKLVAVLDQEHETVEDAAVACLKAMEEIFASRAKFVVVGQLINGNEAGLKVSLGWYSTEGDARAAGESLAVGLQTGEEYRWWMLPVHHGTPADFHKSRRAVHEKWQREREEKRKKEMQAWIEAQTRRNEELAREYRNSCD